MIKTFCKCGCGKKRIVTYPSRIGKGFLKGHFRKFQTGIKNPNWQGGQIYRRGYVFIYSPNHPNKDGNYVKRSRLIMEKKLGRYLLPTEIVHHFNKIRDDDKIENLILITRSNHTLLHIRQGDIKKPKKPPHFHICNFCHKDFKCFKTGKHTINYCGHSCAAKSHIRSNKGIFI
jgi:hypothetical protein